LFADESPPSLPGRARPTVTDLITEEILDLITTEDLNPGDRLPTVQGLARRLEVAAPTVRESLRRLQALGVVEIRHGSGVYVRRRERRVLLANPYQSRLEGRTVLELLDARLLIEPPLAELAAVRVTEEEIAELARTLDQAREALGGPDDILHHLNMAFHRGVARAAGNTILSQTIDSMLDLYAPEQMLILELFGDRQRDHEEHELVLKALRTHEPGQASEAMRLHLEEVRAVTATRLVAPRSGRRQRKAVVAKKR
jgi:GntR family transcriptional regulator, transcriptional repressor for pyruvate dehydrogenase complex